MLPPPSVPIKRFKPATPANSIPRPVPIVTPSPMLLPRKSPVEDSERRCSDCKSIITDEQLNVCSHCGVVNGDLYEEEINQQHQQQQFDEHASYDEGVLLRAHAPFEEEKIINRDSNSNAKSMLQLCTRASTKIFNPPAPIASSRIVVEAPPTTPVLESTTISRRVFPTTRVKPCLRMNSINKETPLNIRHADVRIKELVATVKQWTSYLLDQGSLRVTDHGEPVLNMPLDAAKKQFVDRMKDAAEELTLKYEGNRTEDTMCNAMVSGLMYVHRTVLELDNDERFAALYSLSGKPLMPNEIKNYERAIVNLIQTSASVPFRFRSVMTDTAVLKTTKKKKTNKQQESKVKIEDTGSFIAIPDFETAAYIAKHRTNGHILDLTVDTSLPSEQLLVHLLAIASTLPEYEIIPIPKAIEITPEQRQLQIKHEQQTEQAQQEIQQQEQMTSIDFGKLDALNAKQECIFQFYLKPEYRDTYHRNSYILETYPPSEARELMFTSKGYPFECYDQSYLRSVIAFAAITKKHIDYVHHQFHRHYTTKLRMDAAANQQSIAPTLTMETVMKPEYTSSFVTQAYLDQKTVVETWVQKINNNTDLTGAIKFALQTLKIGVLYKSNQIAAQVLYHVATRMWGCALDRIYVLQLLHPTEVITLDKHTFTKALRTFGQRVESSTVDAEVLWNKAYHYAVYLRGLITWKENHETTCLNGVVCRCYGLHAGIKQLATTHRIDCKRIQLQYEQLKKHSGVYKQLSECMSDAYRTYTTDTIHRQFHYTILGYVILFYALQKRKATRVLCDDGSKMTVEPTPFLKETFGWEHNKWIRSLMSTIETTIKESGVDIRSVVLREVPKASS